MNNKINDGGPAFARDSHMDKQLGLYVQQQGMSLRDHFAAAALQPLVTSAIELDHSKWDAAVQHAYLIADAMLKAREVYLIADAMLKAREVKP